MTGVATTIIILALLFFVFLAVRSAVNFRLCALCAAVSSTWLLLLAFLYLGKDIDPTIVGILMGGSVVGSMYFLESKLPEMYSLFKLPFIATSFWITYLLASKSVGDTMEYIVISTLWILFTAIFFMRHSKHLKGTARRIVECCKNW